MHDLRRKLTIDKKKTAHPKIRTMKEVLWGCINVVLLLLGTSALISMI
jgi:hypothetical protein